MISSIQHTLFKLSLFGLIISLFFSCNRNKGESFSERILKKNETIENEILSRLLLDEPFDSLFIISGPRFEGEVSAIINSSDYSIQDDYTGVFFISGREVVNYSIENKDKVAIETNNGLGYIGYSCNDTIEFLTRGNGIFIKDSAPLGKK